MTKAGTWILMAGLALLAGCGLQDPAAPAGRLLPGRAEAATVGGSIRIDGSSTVGPLTAMVAEAFTQASPEVQISVGISGSTGGFNKFVAHETDISDASRPIKTDEAARCAAAGIEFIELPVAFDGLSVVANPGNHWCDSLTVTELARIWEPGSRINNWRQIRDGFPDVPLKLYGPGVDSGSFDYFTTAIVGEEDASRSDFTFSEDDNYLVSGVAGDRGALGYFGYAYYLANQDLLKLLAIDPGDGRAVAPSIPSVQSGTYRPLSRPMILYVSKQAAETKPELAAFVTYYLQRAEALVPEVGYIPLSKEHYAKALAKFEARQTGSDFDGGAAVDLTIDALARSE